MKELSFLSPFFPFSFLFFASDNWKEQVYLPEPSVRKAMGLQNEIPSIEEQTLYKGLLNGTMFNPLKYEGGLFAFYEEKLFEVDYYTNNKSLIQSHIIDAYRDSMDEEEEVELEKLFQRDDTVGIIKRLKEIEANYIIDFTDLMKERTGKVETVHQEIKHRLNFKLSDTTILALQQLWASLKSLLEKAEESGRQQLRAIKTAWGKAENELYGDLLPTFVAHAQKNSGSEEDAVDIWAKSLVEFRRKLTYVPGEKTWTDKNNTKKDAYYRWYDNQASVKTFFYKICLRRWLDHLRTREHLTVLSPTLSTDLTEEENTLDLFQPDNPMLERLEEVIEQLDPVFQKLIQLHYREGYELKEIAENCMLRYDGQNCYSYGSLRNLHSQCIKQLRNLL